MDDCSLRYRPGRNAGFLFVILSFIFYILAFTQSYSVSKSLVLNEILQTPKTNVISFSYKVFISYVLIYEDQHFQKAVILKTCNFGAIIGT